MTRKTSTLWCARMAVAMTLMLVGTVVLEAQELEVRRVDQRGRLIVFDSHDQSLQPNDDTHRQPIASHYDDRRQEDRRHQGRRPQPSRHHPNPPRPSRNAFKLDIRSIDGTDNNAVNFSQGAADTSLIRCCYPAVYPDGFGDVIDITGRPNARDISNRINAQSVSVVNDRGLTDWIVQWGQFVTHDMDLTFANAANNVMSTGVTGDYSIAINDPFDPLGPNPIPFNRSDYAAGTGTDDLIDSPFGLIPNARQQVNSVTSYIDASNVYGSDDTRAAALRTFSGGLLATSADGQMLPFNTVGEDNDDPFGLGDGLFVAGDVRANEQVGLTATHALFVREHNRLAELIQAQDPRLNDEQVYQAARKIVGAEMQAITYNEFLPALLGDAAPSAYEYAYDDTVDATITNAFATAAFRYGHSMQSSLITLVNNAGTQVGALSLAESFFNPTFLSGDAGNVDLVLKGLATQLAQENDAMLVDEIRNFLFGPPGAGGLDLAALDIQRGRDHGLPDYNALREFYGLEKVESFDQITSDTALASALEETYDSIDNIDPWVGMISEDHLDGASVGELVAAVLVNQFTRLRDGDSYFFTGDEDLDHGLLSKIIDLDALSLSDIIEWNTGLTGLQDNVFFAATDGVVSLVAVPEPATAALVMIGCVMLFPRRRNRAA